MISLQHLSIGWEQAIGPSKLCAPRVLWRNFKTRNPTVFLIVEASITTSSIIDSSDIICITGMSSIDLVARWLRKTGRLVCI